MLLSISFHYWKGISKLWKAERETEKIIKAEEGYLLSMSTFSGLHPGIKLLFIHHSI